LFYVNNIYDDFSLRVLSGISAWYGAAASQILAMYDFFQEVGCCFVVTDK
jgi:hypothetical protein